MSDPRVEAAVPRALVDEAAWWEVECPHCGERCDVAADQCHGCWKPIGGGPR